MPTKQKENSDEPGWSYSPDGDDGQEGGAQGSNKPGTQKERSINWTASEFVDVQRSASWKIFVLFGFVILCILVFLFTRDYISSAVIAIAGIIFLVASAKKPRQLVYEVNEKGVQVGSSFYAYGVLKSFDLVQEGAIKSISFMPMKRFMPEISIYFPPEQEAAIVDVISSHLPHDEHLEKAIDKVARKLHF